MNENMTTILNKIKEYNKIIIFRHFRPDGDAIGSTKGLQRILKLTYPEKEILLINNDYADYLAFLGGEDEKIADEEYADALAIVCDTATAARISNQKFKLCREVVKIDHHIPIESYGNYEWVEEERSSTCEMIACFYDTFSDELKIDTEAATYIYAGMVTDSGRFRYDSTTSNTFRLASELMKEKFDTNDIYSQLYADDFSSVRLRAQFVLKIQFTAHKVAYIYTTKEELGSYGVDTFTISRGMVNTMSDIRGVDIWVNFTETEEDKILVEIRSSKYTVQPIAVKYGGGGHAKACGATVSSREEAMALLEDLNAYDQQTAE